MLVYIHMKHRCVILVYCVFDAHVLPVVVVRLISSTDVQLMSMNIFFVVAIDSSIDSRYYYYYYATLGQSTL